MNRYLANLKHETASVVSSLLSIPRHLVMVVLGLVFAVGNDKTAASFLISSVLLGLTWTWAASGALIAVYGVLMFVQQVVQAFLRA